MLLSAFSGDPRQMPPKPSFTPPRLTACALVTRADVEQALGRPVTDGHEESAGLASTCDYSSKTGLISISIQPLTAKPDRPVEVAALKDAVPDGVVRDARGFPDAFYLDIPGAGTQLHLVNGGRDHLMIAIFGFGDAPQVSPAAERIARKALARL